MPANSQTKKSGHPAQTEAHEKNEQFIQERAYQLYVKRGQEPGHELEDWLQAEREARLSQNLHHAE
jgi:hypothetical protein